MTNMKLDWGNSLLQIFLNKFSFGTTRGTEMLVKYANFVKIQPTAPDKRVRPKASNLLVDLIEAPLSLK